VWRYASVHVPVSEPSLRRCPFVLWKGARPDEAQFASRRALLTLNQIIVILKHMKKQIVVIHGGDTFESKEQYFKFLNNFEIDIERYKTSRDDWKPWLRQVLGDDYEVIIPIMPNKTNAQYDEWKLWMDKIMPFLNDDVILVGHSMGGSFLAKYLSESKFPKKIKAVFLIAAMFDYDDDGYSLQSFALPENLDLQTDKIFLYHSKDDTVVPYRSLENFKAKFPNATVRTFEDRGHCNQETFPELAEDIKNLN